MTASENPTGTPSAATTRPTHYLDTHALNRPNKVALVCEDRSLTYAEFNARARRVAHVLMHLGVQAGDRVALMTHNSIEALEITGGLSKLNAISVLLNYRLLEDEVAYSLNDCQPKVVIADPTLVQIVERARAQIHTTMVFIAIGNDIPPGWLDYEALMADASEDIPPGEGSIGATMSYTSGTTGKPKGAYRLNGVPVADLMQIIQAFEFSPADIHLLAGPYYHSAPSFFTSLHLLLGATIVIQPKYDPLVALQLIDHYKITTTFLAPTLLQRICDVPEDLFARYNTSSLRAIVLAGAICPYALKVRATERLGECLWEFYGATETGIVTLLRPEDQISRPDSCGKIAPGQEIRLLDVLGNEVPDGTPGEMYSRTSWLAEYYNKPEATEKSMKQGFFSVGDIAYRDNEGYYYICDRKVDMVISGGVNIYPAEVEATLAAHPAIADVAVIGVPDEHWGESLKALVELRPHSSATQEELIAFCAERLADYKKPRSVDFVDELPRNPTGKLLKTRIRAPYWKDTNRKI